MSIIGQIGAAVALIVVLIGGISSYVLNDRDIQDHEKILKGEYGLIEAVKELKEIHLIQKTERETMAKEKVETAKRNRRNCALGKQGGMPKSWCRGEGFFFPGGN